MARAKDLIIVESPAKTRTLSSFLGAGYEVRASMGHVRDLPRSRLGVDVEDGFRPSYTVIPERRAVIAELKKAAKNSRHVYLASDPDREGEAIAWHLAEVLQIPGIRRIEFNEITRRAVLEALERPREINMNRVNAQQARRVLDRLVGYKLSPLLWKKVRRNLSAGRVQSVAVRLVVEREREIEQFVTQEYWSLTARLTPEGEETPFEAKLVQIAGRKAEIRDRARMATLLERLGHRLVLTGEDRPEAVPVPDAPRPEWRVAEVRRKEQRRNPPPPFITSTLQQEAARKLGFGARRTMQVAQQLYEGVDLGREGHVGLITYMRTDSVNVSAEAQEEARAFITAQFGPRYVPASPRQYRSRQGAQEAHEAIRPTSVARTPESVRPHLTPEQFRLYQLIWQRFLASQMAPAVYDVTTVDIAVLDLLFRATGRIVKFDGFMALYTEGRDDRSAQEQEEDSEEGRTLPELAAGQLLRLLALLPGQHFTEPPPRYTEATLVRALEENGIGRPSTYAQILSTILEREYVTLDDRRFRPTELGCLVNDLLVRHFPEVVSVDFTAEIEQHLDDISQGERDWVEVLREFYQPFAQDLERAEEQMERVRPAAEPTGISCPSCGRPMIVRTSRYGKFLGCSGFPECRELRPLPEEGSEAQPERSAADDALERLSRAVGQAEATRRLGVYLEVPSEVAVQHARLGVLAAVAATAARGVEQPAGAPEPARPEGPGPCPNCGRPMQLRSGRFGPFWGCTGYPECQTIVDPKRASLPPPDPDFSLPCPRPGCGGTVTARRSRRGKVFYGCSNYNAPSPCDYVAWSRPLPDRPCEACGYPMAERGGKSGGFVCTNDRCPSRAGADGKPRARGKAASAARKRPARSRRNAAS